MTGNNVHGSGGPREGTTRNYLLKTIAVGPLETNCYVIADAGSRKALVIDPGDEAERIARETAAMGVAVVGIVNTHGHYDHIGADAALKNLWKVPVYAARNEAAYFGQPMLNGSRFIGTPVSLPAPDVLLDEGDTVTAGKLSFAVFMTPGHTSGGMCLAGEGLIFTGDTLFAGTIGRSDLPGGDERTLLNSLEKFRAYPGATRILPGHGPETTLAREFETNEFFNR